jgi:citrate synthase
MQHIWEAKVTAPSWGTLITEVKPNNITISGYALQQIVGRKGLLDVANLLIQGEFANPEFLEELRVTAIKGALNPEPSIGSYDDEDISQALARALISDKILATFPQKGRSGPILKTAFALGRVGRYLAAILGNTSALDRLSEESSFTELIFLAITGDMIFDRKKAGLLEAMTIASVDHGVTPPSAQVAIISASTRADYAVSVASGVGAITDVHGGAGKKAALFYAECLSRSKRDRLDLEEATKAVVTECVRDGRRIEGLGHRIHTQDPRRDVLWKLSEDAGIAAGNVAVSKIVSKVFKQVRGMDLPINVDGVIGAIVGDMGLNPIVAKVLFIWGRVAGLSAHYFEEVLSQPEMRPINFSQAVYKGKPTRQIP